MNFTSWFPSKVCVLYCDVVVLQIWDLASGTLKLSLTGHVSTVRGVVVSPRQPYLFSAGEDKQVKCWDLEYNKVRERYVDIVGSVYHLY